MKQMKNTFPKISYRQWKQSAAKTLKGADFDDASATDTYEGIKIKPIYSEAKLITDNLQPGCYPYLRSTSQLGYKEKPRAVYSKIEFDTDFNARARKILSDPDAALIIKFLDEFRTDDFVNLSAGDFERAFDGIDTAKHLIRFAPSIFANFIFDSLTEYCRKSNASECLGFDIEFDCFGSLLTNGGMPFELDEYFDNIELVINSDNRIPDSKIIAINSVVFNSAGASAVQELAFAIASGVDVIRQLSDRNVDIGRIANSVRFHFSAGANFFMEIAKFRAARILWAKIINEFGGDSDSQKTNIHAETTVINMAIRDPHTNMLRGTGEAMAAILGGADSLYVHPYIKNNSSRNTFAERIGRNTQRVIRDESHIGETIDPSGGSYYIESLTSELAESAWKLFQEIESGGGMIKAILNGIPQSRIEKVAAKRQENFRTGRDVLIGVNKYQNQGDTGNLFPDTEKHKIIKKDNKINIKPLYPICLEELLTKDNKS